MQLPDDRVVPWDVVTWEGTLSAATAGCGRPTVREDRYSTVQYSTVQYSTVQYSNRISRPDLIRPIPFMLVLARSLPRCLYAEYAVP